MHSTSLASRIKCNHGRANVNSGSGCNGGLCGPICQTHRASFKYSIQNRAKKLNFSDYFHPNGHIHPRSIFSLEARKRKKGGGSGQICQMLELAVIYGQGLEPHSSASSCLFRGNTQPGNGRWRARGGGIVEENSRTHQFLEAITQSAFPFSKETTRA